MIIHLILLHEKGSSNPSSSYTHQDKIKFNPLFSVKDSLPIFVTTIVFTIIVANSPNLLGDVENFNNANPLVAPVHIQPE